VNEVNVKHTRAVNELPATVERNDTNVLTGNSRSRTEHASATVKKSNEVMRVFG